MQTYRTNILATMNYNTKRPQLILPGYGRAVQQMADHCLTLPDRSERLRCARRIISIMANLFPEYADARSGNKKLWDHLNIMTGGKLDIDFPCDVASLETLHPTPQPIPYAQGKVKLRQYGRLIQLTAEMAAQMSDGEERDRLVSMTAHYMKRRLAETGVQEASDDVVLTDLAYFTDGAISLNADMYRLGRITDDPAQARLQNDLTPSKKKKKKKKKKAQF